MRLIDGDDLWQKTFVCDEVAEVRKFIEQAPIIDAVPVVRCKKCKYIRPVVNEYTHDVTGLWCSLFDIENVAADDYCSHGERRDNDE